MARNICKIDGCGKYCAGLGYCSKHYQRMRHEKPIITWEEKHPGRKRCTRCKEDYPATTKYFRAQNYKKCGLNPICKKCSCIEDKTVRGRTKEKRKIQFKNWYKKNREKNIEKCRMWRLSNKDKKREYDKKWNKKWNKVPRNKIYKNVRNSIYKSLKMKRESSTFDCLPYGLDELMAHLEKQFHSGMGWNNYGEWHIDHKIPQMAFNFKTTKDIDFKRCWALDNLQPMWAIDNCKKRESIDHPFQQGLRLQDGI